MVIKDSNNEIKRLKARNRKLKSQILELINILEEVFKNNK